MAGDKKSKLAALAELKRARAGGARTWKPEEDVELYDEVSEAQYKHIVKGRLQQDDFVVDDGVDGYMDNGMDDWGGGGEYSEEEQDEDKKKKSKKGKEAASKSQGKPKAPPPVAPSINAYRPLISEEKESDFMNSILGTMDSIPVTIPEPALRKTRKRKISPDYDFGGSSSPTPYRSEPSYADTSSDGADFDLPDEDLITSPKKKAKIDAATTHRFAKLDVQSSDGFDMDTSFDDIDFDDSFMDDDLEDLKPVKKAEEKKKPVPKKKEEPEGPPSWLAFHNTLNVADEKDTLGPLAGTSSSSASASKISALEEDGSLRFFWLDYLEHEGRLYFIGKLKDKASGAWVSCCVTVENLQRNIFALPRKKRVEYDLDGKPHETDEEPEMKDVYRDLESLRKSKEIRSWKGRYVPRNYAFGEEGVPREKTQWMKIVYPFEEPALPSSFESPNVAKLFGAGTSAFELLVLKRKIMGPCWLRIKNPQLDNKGVSWCKLEATVSDPKDFNPIPENDPDAPKDTPPLTIMSLSVRTIVNHHENKQEVVCITARTWHNMIIDDPKPPEQLPCTVKTFVRPLDKFPPAFENQTRANRKSVISPMQNERMLLSSLLVTIHKSDPDVIVGHDFLGASLDVLLHRMKELKADHWSRIGRFRRSRWPNIGKQGSNLKFLTGRMLCDLASDGAKSMIASTTWSLTEMCKTHLKVDREDIDPDDTASYLDSSVSSPDRLLKFVAHCELDAHFHMAIASKVQMLPLTKQLTNLAGNSWNKTLNGGRAERNEYILLHEFHRLKYICPDKTYGKKTKPQSDPVDPNDPEAKKKPRRDKYKGGLVFDPKKGLYDKYILVMDFNSLYPSIIQEYNIDFTTIEKTDQEYDEHGEEIQAEPPGPEVPQGVLPRLISTLVNRRRAVKSLMKDKNISPALRLQYDIKQQALKLTANSMYGCLGFEYSRFYARELAALTTYKGREILTHTRELAESMALDVVYGDTDSVFVNSQVTEFPEALKIANQFKSAVNERYKLLEIDLDSIFQRLLLLQKKKYAAVKMEDNLRTSTEIKGLDMKRREYSVLSKNISQYVLDRILSGEATETVVEQIHEYLVTIGNAIRNGKIKLDDYIVFKRLGKDPSEYPKVDGQPHVQVALTMKARGMNARAGDVIPYIFCLPDGKESANGGQVDRVHHPDELRKADTELKIDYDYYISQQILPPIDRLCDPIEGTDRSRLAECLGLDPQKYKNTSSGISDERSFSTLDSQMTDAERFKDATPFLVCCRHCKAQVAFAPPGDRESSMVRATGPICLNESCHMPVSVGSLQFQLETQIRECISRLYEGWTVCDDPTCGSRTRMMGVYGKRCLRPGCRGNVTFEYTDAMLYTQLRYFLSLFDGARLVKNARDPSHTEIVSALVQQNVDFLTAMYDCVDKYLNQCGRRWVEMSTIFSFMKI